MAQLGLSDMRIPIALALGYPDRLPIDLSGKLSLSQLKALHFEEPDYQKFRCLKLALEAEAVGAEGSIVLNAANEVVVDRFLKDQIRFVDIPTVVEAALEAFSGRVVKDLEGVVALDEEVKTWATHRRPGLFSIRNSHLQEDSETSTESHSVSL